MGEKKYENLLTNQASKSRVEWHRRELSEEAGGVIYAPFRHDVRYQVEGGEIEILVCHDDIGKLSSDKFLGIPNISPECRVAGGKELLCPAEDAEGDREGA